MRSSRVLALDFGAGHVGGAIFRAAADRALNLEQVVVESLDSDPATEPRWLEEAAGAIVRLARHIQIRGRVRIAIPGHLALTKAVKTPAIAKTHRTRVVTFEATQGIPYPLEDVWWDHRVIDDSGPDLEILLMAVKREPMAALCTMVQDAGWLPEWAAPSCVALYHGFRFNYPEASGPVLLVSIGARSTHLLLCAGEQFWVRTVAFGGNTLSQLIATRCGVDFAAAEKLKLSLPGGPPGLAASAPERELVQSAAGQFASRLQLEIARSVASAAQRVPGLGAQKLYLTGGGAQLAMLPEFLRQKLGLPVENYDPLRRLVTSVPSEQWAAASSTLASTVGLAIHLAGANAGGGNLLPVEMQRATARRQRQPARLAAAALLVVAFLAPTWPLGRVAATVRAETAAVQAQVRQLSSVAQQNARHQSRLQEVHAELAAMAGLNAARSYWLRLLADLEARLGGIGDVWLDELLVADTPSAEMTGPTGNRPGLRLAIRGYLLEVMPTSAAGSGERDVRMKRLLAALADSPFVSTVAGEHFDDSQPGVLRFGCILAMSGND